MFPAEAQHKSSTIEGGDGFSPTPEVTLAEGEGVAGVEPGVGAELSATGAALERDFTGWRRVLLIRAGEGALVARGAAAGFCVLASYAVLRPLRDSLGVDAGVQRLPGLITATLVLVLMVSPLFSWAVAHVPRPRLVPGVYGVCGLAFLSFYGLALVLPGGLGETPALAYVFFVWTGVFSLFSVSLLWSVLSDTCPAAQGERLFGVIGVGSTLGAVAGSGLASALAPVLPPAHFIPIALGLLAVGGALLTRLADRSPCGNAADRAIVPAAGAPSEGTNETSPQTAVLSAGGRGAWAGVSRVARTPVLRRLALAMALFSITSMFLYFEQVRLIGATFAEPGARMAFLAKIELWANVLTLLVQLFLTARILRTVGIGGTLALTPLLTIGGMAALAMLPSPAVLGVVQSLRRGVHFALDRPGRELVYTHLSRHDRYASKNLLDTFVYRAGDLVGVWLGGALLALGVPLAWVGVPLALGWVLVSIGVGTEVRRLGRS